jgi:hypothetical protein
MHLHCIETSLRGMTLTGGDGNVELRFDGNDTLESHPHQKSSLKSHCWPILSTFCQVLSFQKIPPKSMETISWFWCPFKALRRQDV